MSIKCKSKFKDILEVILSVFERSEKESEKYYDPDQHPRFFKKLLIELKPNR